MANKFEIGSENFQLPEQTKEHYNEKQFEEKRDMYEANDYDSLAFETYENEENYDSKQTKEIGKKLKNFQEKYSQSQLDKELKKAKAKNIGSKMSSLKNIFLRAA